MSANESIYKQHEENTEWSNKLDFYKDEIKILTGRLEEVAGKNSTTEVLAEVEKYQNQLLLQRNTIDEINHLINVNEDSLQEEVNSNPVAVDRRKVEYHATEQEMIVSFEKNFADLRENFNRFVGKWM